MGLSKLNQTVSYVELKRVEPNDINKIADVYQININDTDIFISVGRENTVKDLAYFPIYLIDKSRKVLQIGVYEILLKNLKTSVDEKTGRLDLEKLQLTPIIYAFATDIFLSKHASRPAKSIREITYDKQKLREKSTIVRDLEIETEAEDEEDEDVKQYKTELEKTLYKTDVVIEIADIRKDIFSPLLNIPIINDLKEESKQDALAIKTEYQPGPQDTWIQKFMTNRNFAIINNEGGGDCLFATIRDAFRQIGQETTVNKIREKLAESITESTFDNYYSLYTDAKKTYDTDNVQLKTLLADYEKYKSLIAGTIDKEERSKLLVVAKQIKEKYDRILAENNLTATIINEEFKFMKNIKNLKQFKDKIKTCEFWADTLAISTIERLLNIKFILLSVKSYSDKDFGNVLQCGQLNDTLDIFQPDFYLILEYSGYHYKLITYKKKNIFTFKELPYDIKHMVVHKCLEKNAGPFAIIPDFVSFKNANVGTTTTSASESDTILSDAKVRELYDDAVQFMCYSGSSAKFAPGKGSGEHIPQDMMKIKEFAELHTILDWRKKLDNSWMTIDSPFTLDQYRWASVLHYTTASMYKTDHRDFYYSFSLDSGTALSKDIDLIKYAVGKTGKGPDGFIFRDSGIVIDTNYSEKIQEMNLYNACLAKFSQNKDLKKLLKLTKNAKLVHYRKGKEPEVMEQLMIVREKLANTE